jgi:hypothetical protein
MTLTPVRPRIAGLLAALTVALTVTACGGDSENKPTTPPPPATGTPSPTCVNASDAFSVVGDASVAVGGVAGAVLAGCTGALSEVTWTQTAGPAVTLLSAKTQAISFQPAAAGSYSFTANFRDAGGVLRSASITINANMTFVPVAVVARGDQAVRKGGKVSVRAWPGIATGETLTWSQTAGPIVTLDVTDPNRMLFTAPDVTRDTALVFRVTRRLANGTTDTDDVRVLVENYTQAPTDPAGSGPYVFSDLHVSRVYPYRASGPYANVLTGCSYNAQLQYFGAGTNLCTLTTLPMLHQTTGGAVPTVAQIMDRVLVSHDWMGQVFEQLLTTQATDDLLRLFNGVTAIVIGSQVRPSFYYALTGAIYLDADNFWLTAEQRDVVNEAPDFRSDFDRDLQYSGLWRYTFNNASIFLPFPADSRIPRDITYLMSEAGWLMYHELGHASDFMPVSVRGALNPGLSVWANISPRYQASQLPSDVMTATFPLLSPQMRALAEIKFTTGPAANDQVMINGIPYGTLRTYTPTMVAGFFSPDRATDEYNFTNSREDIAMTFEEFMMVRNHTFRRDVAITDKMTSTSTGSTIIVRWGQRGRIGDANIRPRAQYAVTQLAPWLNATSEISALPAPIAMRPGESWNANLVLPAPLGGMASAMSLPTARELEADRILLRKAMTRQFMGIETGGGHWTPNERVLRRTAR